MTRAAPGVKRACCNACRIAALFFAWQAAAPAAPPDAQDSAQDSAQVVTVQALRDVDEVPYRRILKGIEVFERHHALAPGATLRYRLYPRARGATFDGLSVTLAARKTEIPIPLDDRQTFDLPTLPALADQDAMLMTNKSAGTYAWRVDIRTPGLPPHTRRLGDLRLECMVDMQGARLRRIVMTPPLAAMNAATNICASRTFRNPFFAERPLFGVTLVYGPRRVSLSSEWLYVNSEHLLPQPVFELADWRYTRDRQYIVPLWDAGWPDDTLVQLEYMDDVAPGPSGQE